MIRFFMLTIFFMLSNSAIAQVTDEKQGTGLSYANEQLANAKKEQAAFKLMLELRCIQCQGQSIADSDAPIAQAMRHQVRLQIEQGKQQDEIKDWMVARYGDYVSFDPSITGISLILWLAPILIFLFSIYVVIPLFSKKKDQKIDKQNEEAIK